MRFSSYLFLWILLAGLALPLSLHGQASVNVSTLDPVYRDIDKLVAHGLVTKIIMGQRPFSRREIARITREAMSRLHLLEEPLADSSLTPDKKAHLQADLDYVTHILKRLKRDYREELIQLGALEGETRWYSVHPLEKVELDTTVTNSLPRGFPPNGLGELDAVLNPLIQYRQGRNLVDGGYLYLETSHWLRATDYLAFYARPRFQLAIGRDGQSDDNKAYVQNLYMKILAKNVDIEFGRDQLVWGQGLRSGLLLSDNPRGLDMAKLSNDEPFFFPWVFKYLGAQKLSFFYADLGPEQFFPHSYLTGFKWSLQPVSFFELGFSNAVISGGEGAPPGSFGERVTDVFPFVQLFTGSQKQIDNKMGGVDFRFRIPPARGVELYLEMIFDDTPGSSLKKFFVDDVGYLGGIYVPRLSHTGSVDLRLEYHRTGIRYYRHHQFQSGWSLNRFILGDDLGPDAQGVYATVNWDLNRENLLTLDLAFEDRSNDIYISVSDPGLHFIKAKDNPDEFRVRAVGQWLYRLSDFPLNVTAQLGYERVHNFNFVQDADRNNFLGRVNLQFDLDRWTRRPSRN